MTRPPSDRCIPLYAREELKEGDWIPDPEEGWMRVRKDNKYGEFIGNPVKISGKVYRDLDFKVACPECQAYEGHHTLCSKISLEEAKRLLKTYHGEFMKSWEKHKAVTARAEDRVSKAKEKVKLWHGKFEIIRRENNALRRENARLRGELSERPKDKRDLLSD